MIGTRRGAGRIAFAVAAIWAMLMCVPLAPATGTTTETAADFARRMATERGEDPDMAWSRFELADDLSDQGNLYGEAVREAFLAVPRHRFALADDPGIAYADRPLDIGWGQTISAPHMVARMSSVLAVQSDSRVLEIGTGSGYQAAVLAHLTDHVYSVEIIEPLYERTRAVIDALVADGYPAYSHIHLSRADGYHGWPEHAPYDRIIVTAAIDHIPPPLLDQLAVDGVMVIPVGPPGAQTLLEVRKTRRPDGSVEVVRRDVYEGRGLVRFVPFTRERDPDDP